MLCNAMQGYNMTSEYKTNVPPPPEQAKPDFPVESGKQILINLIIVALGLGGLAAATTVLPELL